MGKSIRVKVDVRGKVTVEMVGYQGEACLTVLQQVLKSLGKATSLTPTAEYYQTESNVTTFEYEGGTQP